MVYDLDLKNQQHYHAVDKIRKFEQIHHIKTSEIVKDLEKLCISLPFKKSFTWQ